jgi:hypothetical protein
MGENQQFSQQEGLLQRTGQELWQTVDERRVHWNQQWLQWMMAELDQSYRRHWTIEFWRHREVCHRVLEHSHEKPSLEFGVAFKGLRCTFKAKELSRSADEQEEIFIGRLKEQREIFMSKLRMEIWTRFQACQDLKLTDWQFSSMQGTRDFNLITKAVLGR